MKRPNVIYIFSDQHRAQACGYAGDPNVHTPNMDALSKECVNFSLAVSGMPVCCPYRASLLTGKYPHHHGVFLNDLCLRDEDLSMGDLFLKAGYDTAYIGKWHLDGHGRNQPIPSGRRRGFQYWKVMECTHNYNESCYYENDSTEKLKWEGYDAKAQTLDAIDYIQAHGSASSPFLLLLSWGPPHDPYKTAPQHFKKQYPPNGIQLRDNVPKYQESAAKEELSGYYAHIAALDECLGQLMDALKKMGIWDHTIFVYTSDHGDMLHSQGVCMKQKPWEESIRVPFLLSYPNVLGNRPMEMPLPFNSPDILPTLLELCHIRIPDTIDGRSFAAELTATSTGTFLSTDFYPSALLQCINPSGEWHKFKGGRPYRGIRTRRYTYVKDLNGPWLLYDNTLDPFQLNNLLEAGGADLELSKALEKALEKCLEEANDRLRPAQDYLNQWKYSVDFLGTNPYEA